MPQKRIQFGQAKKFAKENGYTYAVYEKRADGNFHKIEEAMWETNVENETPIMVKTTGAATDFNEFETVDGQYYFRLHNNFNTPNIIPVFKRS